MDDYDKFCMWAVISMGAALLMLPLMFLIGTILGLERP